MESVDVREVVSSGDRAKTLRVLRDRLAEELDEERAATHRRECACVCGMGDGRVIVALIKEMRAVIEELSGLPDAEEDSPLDRIAGGVADEVAQRRTRRLADAAGP